MKKQKKRPKLDALNPRYQSKVRQEYLDLDYLDQLNDKEKDWLNRFMQEFNSGNANHSGKKIMDMRVKKNYKEVSDSNNRRNRDSFGVTRAQGRLMYLGDESPLFIDESDADLNPENSLIELIDLKNKPIKLGDLQREHLTAIRRVNKRRSKNIK